MMASDLKARVIDRLTAETKPDIERFIRKWAPRGKEAEIGEDLAELFKRVLIVVIPETFRQ